MSNVFFPDRLSPQGFLNDLILSQIRSNTNPFNEMREIIYKYDFTKKLEGKLFYIDPRDRNVFLQKMIPTTPKVGFFSQWKDEYVMRRYTNFLNNMTPVQQAALVPYIRLYVKEFKGNQFIRTKEIVFNREYKIPNNTGDDPSGGRGNAGIQNLTVERDFQYYGWTNRFNVQIDFIFDSFDTFANGMQYENAVGSYINKDNLWGDDQGTGYISLIKKGSERVEDGFLREYLILEYGYKFPDTISEEIISQEDRLIFELQEKKELRINCYKHDFKFSETGEVIMNVSYVASPDVAIASRDEEKTNDVFLISNSGVIKEIMDEPSEAGVQKLALLKDLEDLLLEIKTQDETRRKLLQDYCEDNSTKISEIDKKIQDINIRISSIKKALLNYTYYFFLRYFMTYDSLFTLYFRPVPLEIEKGVLNPCNAVIPKGEPIRHEIQAFLTKVTRAGKKDEQTKQLKTNPTNYREKTDFLIDNKGIRTLVDESTTTDLSMKKENISLRFGSNETGSKNYSGFLRPDYFYESYSCYQALQTFTLARLASQDALIRTGRKAAKCEDLAKEQPDPAQIPAPFQDVSGYSEKYGNITFFPLKALIAAAIDFTLDEEQDQNNFPIICLDNLLTDSMGKTYKLNIGDILVDIDYFREWLMKSFINMQKLDPTLDDFLTSIFQVLVPNILENSVGHYLKGNYGYITRQVFDLSEDVYKRYPQIMADLVSDDDKKRENALKDLAKGVLVKTKDSEIKRPLIFFYQNPYNKPDDPRQAKSIFLNNYGLRKFDKKKDYEDGIYHVLMGQNSGIVKSINFSYMNDPYLNTLFSMKNPNHLAAYLRYSYEANIEFVGNDLFFNKANFFAIPRNQFNVSQNGIGFTRPKDLFGLSGYYQVSKTTDKISMGEYTTTVTAKNLFSPDTEENKVKKCKERPPISDGGKGIGNVKEYPTYLEHDIGTYIFEAFRDVPLIASKFSVKIKEEETKK